MGKPSQKSHQSPTSSLALFHGLFGWVLIESYSPAIAADFCIRTNGNENWRVPNGFSAFCQNHKSDCGKAGRLDMISKDEWKDTLVEINTQVNRGTRYVLDRYLHDHWKAADGVGDCEDYAIEKRPKLIAAGIPASSMRYAFVENKGEPRIVLIVRTDDGDRVLDMNTDTIYPANKTAFKWLSIQSRWNPRKWLKVEN
ncbi:transglutaminase-like cysteine peptidase [Roseibium sp. HPY-6]|uniref:transglutaminase-like cysteine peptidase n=1 Tax=Roseibium sp. HPY-6 TaxID=3229852 RepID=UPI00338D596A